MAHKPTPISNIMKPQTYSLEKSQQGSIIVYVLVAIVLLGMIGSVGALVTQELHYVKLSSQKPISLRTAARPSPQAT
jgi:hypothetical protein